MPIEKNGVTLTAPEHWTLDAASRDAVKLQRMPTLLHGIDASTIISEHAVLAFPQQRTPKGIWCFHGLDRMDVGEMDSNVYIKSVPVALRSEHVQQANDFDAWKYYEVNSGSARDIVIDIIARATGPNTAVKREGYDANAWLINPHWGFWVVF